jgi:hypothetical protein
LGVRCSRPGRSAPEQRADVGILNAAVLRGAPGGAFLRGLWAPDVRARGDQRLAQRADVGILNAAVLRGAPGGAFLRGLWASDVRARAISA